MKNLSFILSFFVFILSCEKNDDLSNIKKYPVCMQSIINNYTNQIENPPSSRASLKKYKFQGDFVYVFDMGNIEEGTTGVYSKNCELICSFGGVLGVNTCNDWEDAELIETVWVDDR